MTEEHEGLVKMYEETFQNIKPGKIVNGKVIHVDSKHVLIDIGYKSEGSVELAEFSEPVNVGDEISVVLERLEDENGVVVLSKERADQLKNWERLTFSYHEDRVIEGKVMRRVKGGYLVDIEVEGFLPSSQVSLQSRDVIGQVLPLKIIKMSEAKRNIVVSHRVALEAERDRGRSEILSGLNVGEMCKGKVKNITDFGAFIDLGGIDGLLHVTDIYWGRESHHSEILSIGDYV